MNQAIGVERVDHRNARPAAAISSDPGPAGCGEPCQYRVSMRPVLAFTTRMKARIARLSTSNRRKLTSILLAVVIFGLLTVLTTLALGRPVINGILTAIIVGTGAGLFEKFYVQNARGRWFRSIHPLKSMLIYVGIVAVMFILSTHLIHVIFWNFDDLAWVYRRLPMLVPIVITFSVIGIGVMRVAHFIGLETLFHLTIGTYHRPVVEKKVLMFLDINNSTALAAQLGAIETKSFVGKFIFDISAPITNNGGDIYLYKGDGLIALMGLGRSPVRRKDPAGDRRGVRGGRARACQLS